MSRSCGLRIGPRRYELVVLDGSPKKHKIAAYAMGDLPHGNEEAAATAAAVLRAAVKEHGVPADNVGIAIDTGLAAFRPLKLPFSDRNKIEEVVKFEVESHLPQWNIDDVVIDFHVVDATTDASELIVTAVQKSDVRAIISLAEKAGIEPLELEVETTAMVNAALASDLCSIDDAQVLVHVGESSTSVVVVDGRKVREMRAIRIGALAHEPTAVEEPAEGEEKAEVAAEPRDPEETARRLDQAIKRIRRELGRTLSAARTAHPIEAVYVCGFELPGLVGSKILDADVLPLDVFQKDGGQPAEGFGPLVVAYGVALRQLGGGELRPHLRREELHYAGAFEKVELPLAVVALLAVTLLGVWFIFLTKETQFVDSQLAYWRNSAQKFLIGDLKAGKQGYLLYPSDPMSKYLDNLDADAERNKFEQLQYVNGQLKQEIKKLEKDLGQDAEITQPQSALVGSSLVLGVLEKSLGEGARPSLRKLQSTYTIGKQGKSDYVSVKMDVTFFAADSVMATQNYEDFIKAIEAQPWCIGKIVRRASETLENGEGIFVAGLVIDVDVTKANLEKVGS